MIQGFFWWQSNKDFAFQITKARLGLEVNFSSDKTNKLLTIFSTL